MKELRRDCFVVLLMLALFVALTGVLGFTPDGILYGHWPEDDDHPTNWYETALHPEAQ
jgi:hypothetical protein